MLIHRALVCDRSILRLLICAACTIPLGCGSDDGGTAPGPVQDAGVGGDGSSLESGADGAKEGGADGTDGSVPASLGPWVVFTQAGSSAPMSDNKLLNPDFEAMQGATAFSSWTAFGSGYGVATGEGRSGNGVKLVRAAGDTASYGAYQSVQLDQTAARPIYFSGWSKANGVGGDPDNDASIYLDIAYKTKAEDPQNGCEKTAEEPCSLYGQVPKPRFDTGTHDWQQRDGFAVPAYPIKSVSFYVLLRGSHEGTLLFDDVALKEVDASILSFDGTLVSSTKPTQPYTAGDALTLATGDGLQLSIWSQGAAAGSAKLDGTELMRTSFDYASGFILHEADADTWWAPGGYAVQNGTDLAQHAEIAPLEMQLDAIYSATQDRIQVHAEVVSTSAQDRALTLYWALPVESTGWSWGDDIRTNRAVSGVEEFGNLTSFWGNGDLGATGQFSRYPFATVFSADRGLALGYPLDQMRIARLVHHPVTGQVYVAFDVGLTADAKKLASRATVDLVLYRTSHAALAEGFRSALQGFQDRFPDHFARRLPADKEGVWAAFADLSAMQHGAGESVEDFNIGFHEGDPSQVAFDDQHGIQSFRYIIEPSSTWLQIEDSSIDPNNKTQVTGYLQQLYQSGTASQKKLAEKTLSSVIYDRDGTMAMQPYDSGPPWCSGKCALFYVSPDPDINEPPYGLNQASYHWNDDTKSTYTTTPGLDGEYLDSFVMEAKRADFRRSHFAAADTPLTFTFDKPHAVVVPMIFSTMEFARWLRPQLPQGKGMIANAMLIGVPWGAELFDFGGEEIDWVTQVAGQYQIEPEADWLLSYRRSMSGQRPYGFLLNTDFNHVSKDMVERYMRLCLFYGIYPSMFSANASEGNYFETAALYNRDRPLFKKYIPIIRSLNSGGWRPVTHATPSNNQVYLERFGAWPASLYLTLRNMTDQAATVTIQLDRAALGISAAATVHSVLLGSPAGQLGASVSTFDVTLPAGEIEAVQITP